MCTLYPCWIWAKSFWLKSVLALHPVSCTLAGFEWKAFDSNVLLACTWYSWWIWVKDFWLKSARELRLPRCECQLQAKSPSHQVSWTSAGSAHMPFIFIKKLKFSLQRGHQSTRLPARPNSTRSWRIPQYWKLRTHWLTLGRATNATPPKMWMPVVKTVFSSHARVVRNLSRRHQSHQFLWWAW